MTIQKNGFPIPQNPANHSKDIADLDVRPDQGSYPHLAFDRPHLVKGLPGRYHKG